MKRRSRARWWLRAGRLAPLLALLFTHIAGAAEATAALTETAPTRASRERARALHADGLAAFDRAAYEEALESFRNAHREWENPKLLINIASCLRALGRPGAAATHYVLYLQAVGASGSRFQEIRLTLRQLEGDAARVVFRDPRGIERAWLDGELTNLVADQEIWLEAGTHTIIVQRAQQRPVARRVALERGEVLYPEIQELQREPAIAPPLPALPRRLAARAQVSEASLAPTKAAHHAAKDPRPILVSSRVDVDGTGKGAMAAAGMGYDATTFLRATAGGLLGSRPGFWVGLELAPLAGPLSPILGVSCPTFYAASLHPGVSVELGARYAISARFSTFARVGVVHFPDAPVGYAATVLVPAAGVDVRL